MKYGLTHRNIRRLIELEYEVFSGPLLLSNGEKVEFTDPVFEAVFEIDSAKAA